MALVELGAGSGVFYETSTTGSGTGNYNSFLRLQSKPGEKGFNTDDPQEADNKDGIWTHALRVGSLVEVDIGGVKYYEIRLDLNEGNAAGDPPITLEDLRLFYSAAPADGDDYNDDFAGLTKVFDLSGNLALTDINSGSGTDDYRFLIRADLFPDKNAYFTLYSQFSGSDGGFEEWRAKSQDIGDGLPAITLVKEALPITVPEGTPTDVTYTYTLTSQSSASDPLTLTSFVDDGATPLDSSDDIDLLEGVDATHLLGIHYVSGDADNDQLLDSTETWIFSYTRVGVLLDGDETLVNVAAVTAIDNEGNNVSDNDDATVTGEDLLPAITLVKAALPTAVDEGKPTNVTYTYTLTSQSAASDPLTVLTLVDDNGTPGTPGDDINLLAGVDPTHLLGTYYVSGDADNDQLLDSTESWVFSYTRTGVVLNGDESLVNVAAVTATDDEGNSVGDDDDATVTGTDILPDIGIVKTASITSIQAGAPTLVTFSYSVTNDSVSPLDPLTLTSLVDDSGTISDVSDDVDLLEGIDGTHPLGIHYVSGDDGDGLLENGETWLFQDQVTLTLNAGETRTNIVTVNATDDEDNPVSATDDASVTAYNLGRTPGFWSNNGSLLWDGNTGTFPKAGGLGIVAPGQDLAYAIFDLNGDGAVDSAGSRQYLMIGDWDRDGVADANENVLVVSRADALSLLQSSEKLQQDGRYTLSRDMIASWLNYLGGSYVGDSDDPNSAMHYIDEATAWLIETTSNQNHVLTKAELTAGTKVAQSSSAWSQGFDYDGDAVKGENMVPAAGQHDIGLGTTLDILGGSTIHAGLDHYNNFGFI